jgi:hypothetical protein
VRFEDGGETGGKGGFLHGIITRMNRRVERCFVVMSSRVQTSDQTRLSITGLLRFTDGKRNVLEDHFSYEDFPFKEGKSS